MKLWSAWFPDIFPHVPGCPAPIVVHELRRTAQEYLKATRAWKVTLNPIPVLLGTTSITIPLEADKAMIEVEAAWYDGNKLSLVTPSKLDGDSNDDWRLHTGSPTALVQFSPGVVSLYPLPIANSATGLKVRASIYPSDASTGLTDEIGAKFFNEIAVGAKGKLMIYPNRPWTNIDIGASYIQQFASHMDSGVAAAARSFVQGRIASRPHWG